MRLIGILIRVTMGLATLLGAWAGYESLNLPSIPDISSTIAAAILPYLPESLVRLFAPLDAWHWVLVVAVAIFLISFAVDRFLLRPAQAQIWLQISDIYNEFHFSYRAILQSMLNYQELLRDSSVSKKDKQSAGESYRHDFRDFNIALVNCAARVFTLYSGKNTVHCSYKSFDPDSGNIRTEFRDENQDSNRKLRDKDDSAREYLYTNNTAFVTVLDSDKHSFFASNCLRLRSSFIICLLFGWSRIAYRNGNPSWRKFYRRTLVVPVTEKSSDREITKNSVYGFLCFDSKKANLSDPILINMAKQLALMYYVVVASMSDEDLTVLRGGNNGDGK